MNTPPPEAVTASGLPDNLYRALIEYYETENRDRKSRRRAWKPWLEVAAVVIALIVAVLTLLAVRVANHQTKAATEQLRFNVEAFRTDERAWIEIDSIRARADPPAAGFPQSFKYDVYLKNVGKTAARNAVLRRVQQGGSALPSAASIDIAQKQLLSSTSRSDPKVPPYPLPTSFAPNAVLPIPFTIGGNVPQNNVYQAIIGRVDYADVFGTPHWMTFCFVVWNLAGDLQYCEYGNDEDNNAPPLAVK
jgi:hypothetical protein